MDPGLSFDTTLNILSQSADFDGFGLLSYSTISSKAVSGPLTFPNSMHFVNLRH